MIDDNFEPRPTGAAPKTIEITGKLLGLGVVGSPCLVQLSRFETKYLPLFDGESELRDMLGLAGCFIASIKKVTEPSAFVESIEELRASCGDVRVITGLRCKNRKTLHMVWLELRL